MFYKGETAELIDKLFNALSVIVTKKTRVGITKIELEELIRSELVSVKKGPATVVYLHGWIQQEYSDPADSIIDWTRYFDHATLETPPHAIWQEELLPELVSLREKFDADGSKRNIWLRSKAPLSAGLAFGNVFSEALGYNIQIEQPSPGSLKPVQYWQTDTPDEKSIEIKNSITDGLPNSEDLVIGIGVTDDPKPKMEEFLQKSGLKFCAAAYLYPSSGPDDTVIDEQTSAGFARSIKKEIRKVCSQFNPKKIHLFYFGPLALAVLLGQKLNGLSDIQCYERSKEQAYVPSCLINA